MRPRLFSLGNKFDEEDDFAQLVAASMRPRLFSLGNQDAPRGGFSQKKVCFNEAQAF